MPVAYDAVVMLGFGGPTSVEEVRPFILNVVRGRPVPPERIEQVVEQYRAIGGKSPFNELTRRQAKALQSYLAGQGLDLPVYVGMLNWSPYIKETIESMAANKVHRAVGIIMSPHRSDASFGRYVQSIESAIANLENWELSVHFVSPWYDHRLYIEAVVARVREALVQLPERERLLPHLIFTAHSIPIEMAGSAEYQAQIGETAKLAAYALGYKEWSVAYTSRSGSHRQEWLEPDVLDLLTDIAKKGTKNALVVPIGFVCDHVEVLYDLDVRAANKASELGVNMIRAATVGNHAKFIELLSELVTIESAN